MTIEITYEELQIIRQALSDRADKMANFAETYRDVQNRPAQMDCISERRKASKLLEKLPRPPK